MMTKSHVLIIASFLFVVTRQIQAVSVADYAVQVSGVIETNPLRITLSWPPESGATGYYLYRKSRDATSWGGAVTLGPNATNCTDATVVAGSTYEYRVIKTTSSHSGVGYIYMGIEAPLSESRGKVILVVDDSQAAPLALELARLQQDLIGDGWTVIRHDVARSNSVPSVKALIVADYLADPANVKAVFLFGHVPVPYSGELAPDGHGDHQGAWPADVYYGDIDGVWTDSTVNNTFAGDPRNWNQPGDGKFDQTTLPSDVELQVGRVDFVAMSDFSQSESELLQQYLNKDHQFRHKLTSVQRRGLIDDNFGVSGGEAFAANGWRNFSPFFNATNTFELDWFSTLNSESYLWAYGCGGGSFNGAIGIGSTGNFVATETHAVFTMLFGSYFGDWDSPNDFLRAPLAAAGNALTCVWAGRPNWQFHHMALGETIGFSTRLSQNNSTLYAANSFYRYVHIALMGDPTLRMHPVAPPAALVVVSNSLGMDVTWSPASELVEGYHIYRAPTVAGPFTRLNATVLTGTNYTDSAAPSSHYVYMVRAIKLETSDSGSYYNASQGVLQNADGKVGATAAVLLQPTNNAAFVAGASIQLTATIFDPSNKVTRLEYFANGVKIGETNKYPYSVLWTNVPAGDRLLTVSAFSTGGPLAESPGVSVHVGTVAPHLSITPLSNGAYAIRGSGIAGYSYQLQAATDLQASNWQYLGTVTADSFGKFNFTNADNAIQRFYRTQYP